jgi:hypothetical protein
MPASNYLRGKVIDLSLRATAYSAPASVYVSLHTADPTAGAIAGTEVSGGWYARKVATFSAQSTAGQTSNAGTITYDPVTGGPVTVTHFAVWDAETLGNMLYYGSLASSKTFATTDVPSWLAGQIAITAS